MLVLNPRTRWPSCRLLSCNPNPAQLRAGSPTQLLGAAARGSTALAERDILELLRELLAEGLHAVGVRHAALEAVRELLVLQVPAARRAGGCAGEASGEVMWRCAKIGVDE